MIGITMPSISDFFSSSSSLVADSAVDSTHDCVSLTASRMVFLSSSESFPPMPLESETCVHVVLQCVLGLDVFAQRLVFACELFRLANHALNLLLTQAALLVRDGDGLGLSGGLISGTNGNTVGVDLECHLNLRDASRRRRDAGEIELAEEVIILGHRALALENLDEDEKICDFLVGMTVLRGINLVITPPVVSIPRVSGQTSSRTMPPTPSSSDRTPPWTAAPSADIGCYANAGNAKNVDHPLTGDGLVGIDIFARFLAVEKLLEELLDLGNTSRPADENDVVDVGFGDLGVFQDLLDGLESLTEKVVVELLKLGTQYAFGQVDAVAETLDLNAGGHLRRESAFHLGRRRRKKNNFVEQQ
ncbi:MAG: NAD-specific glutamate dehydrogenase-domain-containing protein [Olpidium bornovanus]|uniref:NAD-specific glutamate dehydrogenase-domain-containing protein n=1 Tax=Olpidium bornovanus TaxID=278681 RepID=A0A8H7ZPY4_9FUNG|nr:MAG: NAD-specific glutamate dehydrogenase-domain-containing protein [Olpidium bornovanus]